MREGAAVTLKAAGSTRIGDRELLLATFGGERDGRERSCWFVVLGTAGGGRLIAGGAVEGAGGPLADRTRGHERKMSAAGLCTRLMDGAQRTRDAGLPVERELVSALALTLDALRCAGEPVALRRLPDAGDDTLWVSGLDDGTRLFGLMDELLDEFECETPEDRTSPVWRSGDLVAGAMIEFKGRYADGRLDHWTCADVREFMLAWLPRVLVTDDAVVADVGPCVNAFLRFLLVHRSLAGDPLADLEAASAAAAVDLPARCETALRTGAAAALWRMREPLSGPPDDGSSARGPAAT